MAQSRIPRYGIWKDGDSNGFTIEFEKVRTLKQAGSIITRNDLNQDVLPDRTEPRMNQDMGPTLPPETSFPEAKARPDRETRKDNKVKSIRPNGGRVKTCVDAPTKPQEVKLDKLTAKKPSLRPGKPRSKSPPDGSPDVSPPVPEFGAWDKSQNFTDIFKRNQKGVVDGKPDPTRCTTEKSKKGGFYKWLCGCCFL